MQCQGPDCTTEIEQAPGGHRQRAYCSDRCRMAASRQRAYRVEQARLKAEVEAKEQRERQELRNRYPMLAEESIDLLYNLKKQYQYGGLHLVSVIGAALVRENERPGERALLAADLFVQGQKKSYPAVTDNKTGRTLIWGNLADWFAFCNKSDVPTLRQALALLQGNPNVTGPARSGATHVTIG